MQYSSSLQPKQVFTHSPNPFNSQWQWPSQWDEEDEDELEDDEDEEDDDDEDEELELLTADTQGVVSRRSSMRASQI